MSELERARGGSASALVNLYEYIAMIAVLGLLILAFGMRSHRFLMVETFQNIANQIPALLLASVGMTYVLIIGGIDLSVGSVLSLGGVVICYLMAPRGDVPGYPAWIAIAACLGVGLVCGLLNGALTVGWCLPSFIVTLGMLQFARGLTYDVSDSKTIFIGSEIAGLDAIRVFGLSLPFLIALAVVIVGQWVLSCTVFGRYMIAIGTNEEAVRLSGIRTWPVKVTVFALCGFLASLAAVMDVSRRESADPNMSKGFELEVIAAVVIGGTSLMGGRGSVIRSFLGALIISVLGAGLSVIDVRESRKLMVTGTVIVAAAVLDYYRQRIRRAS